MIEEQQFVVSEKKIKDLFPDGKMTGHVFRISSEVYNSVNNERPKKKMADEAYSIKMEERFMTRHELHHILETPSFDERRKKGLPVFDWEHCAKSFQHIPNDLAMKHFMELNESSEGKDRTILKCKCNSDVYYFGIGLKDCENISLKKLKTLYQHGTWSIYTWCD